MNAKDILCTYIYKTNYNHLKILNINNQYSNYGNLGWFFKLNNMLYKDEGTYKGFPSQTDNGYKLKINTMKTAMQLMLDDLELRYKILSDAQMLQAFAAIEGTIEYAKSLIIKEKEQIMDAYNHNMTGFDKLEQEEIGLNWAEDYYNQTYNQNK